MLANLAKMANLAILANTSTEIVINSELILKFVSVKTVFNTVLNDHCYYIQLYKL